MKKRNRSGLTGLSLLCLLLLGVGFALRSNQIRQTSAAQTPQDIKSSPDNLWQEVKEASLQLRQAERQIVPQSYRTVRLNRDALAQLLGQTPMEFTEAARQSQVEMTLPMPDGGLARFRIEESPVMEPGLAAQAPELKTYRGGGIDDPTATLRFGVTPAGFHAIILSAKDSVYVDPYAQGDTDHYISYYKRDYRRDKPLPSCLVKDSKSPDNTTNIQTEKTPEQNAPEQIVTRRTYKLALAVTGEYSLIFAPPFLPDAVRKSMVLSQMVVSVNRVNAIYEREVAVHLNLIDTQFDLIHLDPTSDGYTNGNASAMMSENAAKLGCDNYYDLGHVVGTTGSSGNGVVVEAGTLCETIVINPQGTCVAYKAMAATNYVFPVGDAFDVDYFAHELGHQFGADHTFNGTTGGCGASGQRTSGAAYEPGSGTTIMAYAGTCGGQNVQPNSNDYFHAKTIQQINSFINRNCGGSTPSTNNSPVVSPKDPSYTIPHSTPFTLEGLAFDPDGDFVTYCWEEYDLGPSSTVGTDHDRDGADRPIFRSYPPSDESSRTFPRLDHILKNDPPDVTFEALPFFNFRTMTFRLTGRDNRGGTGTATTTVNVIGDRGPFRVTSPNTAETWAGGSIKRITWDVAGTNLSPIGAGSVKISLMTYDGVNIPSTVVTTTLLSGTVNNGNADILVPNIATQHARVKVEALANIFFDVSDADFSICAAPNIFIQPADVTVSAGTSVTFSPGVTGATSFQWRRNGVPIVGATGASHSIPSVSPSQAGVYDIVVTSWCGQTAISRGAQLTVNSPPVITSQPVSVAGCLGQPATFSVAATGTDLRYQWRMNGGNIIGATGRSLTIVSVSLADLGNYDVVVSNSSGQVTSSIATLTVSPAPVITSQPASAAVCEGARVTFSVAATGNNLRYQWRRNGTNIPGATGPILIVVSASLGDAGNWDVVVTDTCGRSVNSFIASLTVNSPITITSHPQSVGGCVGQPVSFSVAATGSNLRYQWRKDGGNIPGATGASLNIPSPSLSDAGTYSVVVYNGCSTINSGNAILTVNGPISITSHPVNVATCLGRSATFSVNATGSNLRYQWRKNGGNIPGATSSSYTIPSVSASDAGAYSVVVYNGCSTVTSNAATLSVTQNCVVTGLQYYPLPRPIRLLDTRPESTACNTPGAPLANDGVFTLQAQGGCEGLTIPASAKAIVGNATVVNVHPGSQSGWITLYPSDAAQPNVSNLNYTPNQITPNAITVGLGTDGKFKIYSRTATHFIVDITGYYAPPGTGGLYFHPLPRPLRVLDTRPNQVACDAPGAPLAADASRTQLARRTCDSITIPANAQAVVGNATVVNALPGSSDGWITFYPSDAALPPVSNLNYVSGQITPNKFTVGLGGNGSFNIYSRTSTHFIVDIVGYFSPDATDTNGQGLLYYGLDHPIRLLDTRQSVTACDAPGAALSADASRTQQASRSCDGVTIPASARAVVGNATVVNVLPGSSSGWITLYPDGAALPNASNLNYVAGQITPNSFIVGLGASGAFKIYARTSTHFIVDLSGYFAP